MSPAQPSPSEPKRRRWFQFSLRTMLLATVVFALLCGWLGKKVRVGWKQQEAVKAILALGGEVRCEYEDEHYGTPQAQFVGPLGQPPEPPGPEWLRTLLGEQFFSRVTMVQFPAGVGDTDLRHLDDLPYITRLHLSGSMITEDGLSRVWKHESLVHLDLRSSSIGDDEIVPIELLSRLKELNLRNTAITDKTVDVLARLPNLESLQISGTHISPRAAEPLADVLPTWGGGYVWAPAPSEEQRRKAVTLERYGAFVTARRKKDDEQREYGAYWGFRRVDDHLLDLLEDLEGLRSLTLVQTSVTNQQWSRIADSDVSAANDMQADQRDWNGGAGWTRLTGLCISNVPITDTDMQHVAGLVNLEVLYLLKTQITDAGLAHLGSLQNLKYLNLRGPLFTDAGLVHLKSLRQLEELDLSGAQFTDAALAHVGTLANLETLSLYAAPVTDAGLAHLTGLTKLKDLNVNSPNITDAGITHLAELPSLTELDLAGPQITPAGLEQLKKLPQLKSCRVNGKWIVRDPDGSE